MIDLYNNLLYFLSFAIAATCVYWIVPRRFRSLGLLCTNILFYTVCAGWYIIFVLVAGLWSFHCAKKINEDRQGIQRKKWLLSGIIALLLLLCFFKYWTPSQSLIGQLLDGCVDFNIIQIVLPLGMSYYILKSISYLVDVYKKKIDCEGDVINYLAYVSFYGQIVSGPIQRYEQWKSEIMKEMPTKNWKDGFYHVLLGLFMKLVIANRLCDFITATIQAVDSASGLQLWLCFFLYSIYIYCDFAGYSYIAIGVTHFHGLDCIANFNRPYFSKNIREFWNRWHISLSSWLRDYVYIPLGGNRKGKFRRVLNVMITFVTCGIWHGSTLSFAVWGGYHGVVNALTPKRKNDESNHFKNAIRIIWTLMIVSAGWVFFASPTLGTALAFFKGMFTRLSFDMSTIQESILPFTGNNNCLAYFITVLVFIFILFLKEADDEYGFLSRTKVASFLWQVFLLSSILLFGVFGASSFIYAGF